MILSYIAYFRNTISLIFVNTESCLESSRLRGPSTKEKIHTRRFSVGILDQDKNFVGMTSLIDGQTHLRALTDTLTAST